VKQKASKISTFYTHNWSFARLSIKGNCKTEKS